MAAIHEYRDTKMIESIDNRQDIIDSRDIIERIEHLESMLEDEKADGVEPGEYVSQDELAALKSLAKEGEEFYDWPHGSTLIRDSYFKEYAMDLAEDIGAIDSNASWPNTCIDWDQAAKELQHDYTTIEFGGVDYWIR